MHIKIGPIDFQQTQRALPKLEFSELFWSAIGEALLTSTKQRFATSTAPDGTQWQANTQTTIDAFVNRFSGTRTKKNKVNAKGRRIAAGKKPLIGESRALSQTINYTADNNSVEIGSPLVYAATHQFGAKRGQYGKSKKNSPIPWGDIPARPFLGISSDDEEAIRDTFGDFIDTFGRSS